jgi:hypothetical protein
MIAIRILPLFILCLLTSSAVSGQVATSVAATKFNLLYRDIPNPVRIMAEGVYCEDIEVTVSSGEIEGEGCAYSIMPGDSPGVTFSIWQKSDTLKTLLGEWHYRVKSLPDPKPYYAGCSPEKSTVKKNDAMIAAGVRAAMWNFDFDIKWRVQSFAMIIERDGELVADMNSSNNRVTEEMKHQLKVLQVDDHLQITDIIAKGPNDILRILPEIILRIVN